jgi:hypothetical protein
VPEPEHEAFGDSDSLATTLRLAQHLAEQRDFCGMEKAMKVNLGIRE